MADSRKEYKRMRREYTYVDGNTVRKLDVAQEVERTPRERRSSRTKKEKVVKTAQAERVKGLDPFSVLFLTAVIILTCYACVKYIGKQTEVTHLSDKVAAIQKDIVQLQEENKTAEEELSSSVDLDHIYKVATKKLGMVHPSEKQVVTYKSTKSDAVEQYGDIPSDKNKSLMDNILGK